MMTYDDISISRLFKNIFIKHIFRLMSMMLNIKPLEKSVFCIISHLYVVCDELIIGKLYDRIRFVNFGLYYITRIDFFLLHKNRFLSTSAILMT